jgi:hypothetical protein
MAFTLSTEVVEVVRTGSKSNDLGERKINFSSEVMYGDDPR